MIRFLVKGLVLLVVLAAALAGAAAWWIGQPLTLATETVDVSIEPGSSARDAAQAIAQAGVTVNPTLLYAWFRVSGDSRRIKAGSYELEGVITPKR